MSVLPPKRAMAQAVLDILAKADSPMKASDINDQVAIMLKISDDVLAIEDANCTGTEFSYQMRWIRTDLKKKNLIQSPSRGFWSLV